MLSVGGTAGHREGRGLKVMDKAGNRDVGHNIPPTIPSPGSCLSQPARAPFEGKQAVTPFWGGFPSPSPPATISDDCPVISQGMKGSWNH